MNEQKADILFIAFGMHMMFALIGSWKLYKSNILTHRQKMINAILLWLIPFIWYLLIESLHKKTPGSHEVPKKDDVSNNPFHESGKGW